MTIWFGVPQAIVAAVGLQRLAEMALARRNTRRLLASGGREVGAAHYPLFVLLHASWLLSLFTLVDPDTPVAWWLIGAYAVLQVGRAWVMITLGSRWTTRVIVMPGAPLMRRGPYRWLRHPNYMIVAAEMALLPLAFGAWEIAGLWTALNGALLAWRIRVEENALRDLR